MCRSAASALGAVLVGAAALAVAPAPSAAWAEPPLVRVAGDTTGGRLSSESAAAGLPVRSIEVRPRDIYDPVPPGRLGPLYRAANRLHFITRRSTVRSHLGFGPGEPWDDERARETLRLLRTLDFLDPLAVRATTREDSVDVTVETRDVWSTIPEFNVERGGGQTHGAVGFNERNLWGLGKSVAVAYRDDPTGISRAVSWSDPAVAGSRARMHVTAGSGSAGVQHALTIGVPYWSQDAPFTLMGSWARTTSVGRLFDHGEEGATFDQRREDLELTFGRGSRVAGTVRRVTWSFLARDRRLGPSRLATGSGLEFDGGEENLRLRRLAVELRVWRPRFIERRAIDRMVGIEDFDVGANVAVKLGLAPRLLGSDTDESYARFNLDGGAETRYGFGLVRASMSTRFRYQAEEMVRSLDARWVSQVLPGQTLVASGWGLWGMRMARDWQVVVGGLDGLRAYPVHALTGRQVWRFNLEDRWLIGRDLWQLVNLGAAAFWDGARAWGTGAEGTGWLHDAGVGLRVALPHMSANQVIRLDVAWPLETPPGGAREPVFSFGSRQAF